MCLSGVVVEDKVRCMKGSMSNGGRVLGGTDLLVEHRDGVDTDRCESEDSQEAELSEEHGKRWLSMQDNDARTAGMLIILWPCPSCFYTLAERAMCALESSKSSQAWEAFRVVKRPKWPIHEDYDRREGR